MSQIYKKILIVKRFGVKKIGENVTVKQNEAIKDLTPDPNRPHPRPLSEWSYSFYTSFLRLV